jgi:hypothetical protein
MIKSDISMLTESERELLDHSFHPEQMDRRTRGIMLSVLVVVAAVTSLGVYGLSAEWFAGVTIAVLAVSTLEKILYQRAMLNYESLIRKLVHRVEKLEGVKLTPENTDPSVIIREAS